MRLTLCSTFTALRQNSCGWGLQHLVLSHPGYRTPDPRGSAGERLQAVGSGPRPGCPPPATAAAAPTLVWHGRRVSHASAAALRGSAPPAGALLEGRRWRKSASPGKRLFFAFGPVCSVGHPGVLLLLLLSGRGRHRRRLPKQVKAGENTLLHAPFWVLLVPPLPSSSSSSSSSWSGEQLPLVVWTSTPEQTPASSRTSSCMPKTPPSSLTPPPSPDACLLLARLSEPFLDFPSRNSLAGPVNFFFLGSTLSPPSVAMVLVSRATLNFLFSKVSEVSRFDLPV